MPFVKRGTGKKKGEEGYGQGEAHIAFDDDVFIDEDTLVTTLVECLESPSYRPPTLPAVAVELLNLSSQPDVDLADIATLLEKDALIAGRILKMVSSAAYSGAHKITSVQEALVRLGIRTLRDVVMEIALNLRVFQSDDYAYVMDSVRNHATMTAHLSKAVSNYTTLDGEYAFMAGLMHDVGIAGTLLAISDRKGKRKTAPDLVSIWPAVGRVHHRAGELMARHWQLPPEIEMSIAAHHNVLIDGYAHPLAAIVCVADHHAHEAGWGVLPQSGSLEGDDDLERDCLSAIIEVDRSSPRTVELACEAIELDEPKLVLVQKEVTQIRDKLAAPPV